MMQLTDLLDVLGQQDVAVDSEVPCQENDAEIWFEQTPAGVEFAKALCQTCPVRAICLAGAHGSARAVGRVGWRALRRRRRHRSQAAPWPTP